MVRKTFGDLHRKFGNMKPSTCALIFVVILLFGLCAAEEVTVKNKTEETDKPESVEVFKEGDVPNKSPIPMGKIAPPGSSSDSFTGRVAPPLESQRGGIPYVITETRLREIRKQFMYWYFDQGGSDNEGDHQKNIHTSTPQLHKNLNFQLPFFGFRFNYTRISMYGYMEFSDPPDHFSTYPLVFPVKEWPKENDPSFIGPFYSKMRVGATRVEDMDQRRAGVYFRLERDLPTRTDQFGVEFRERLKWDIRQGVIDSETFEPKHAIIATWKNMTFAGGIDDTLYVTNTFQVVLATDEVFTYAMFNYLDINWTTHTEAGGDTSNGVGGTPAYVGFNAGNGTQSFEYYPYSQQSTIRDLTERGCANGFKGRHIFRIDEKIMLGTCNKEVYSFTSRVVPPLESQRGGIPYVITETRLREIRKQFMYWYFDQGGSDNEGDHQKNIHTYTPQLHKNLNFQLPFFGFRFNYTRISMNGYMEFSDPPDQFSTYPLVFPVKEWPKENDPSFIGPFYSKMRVGATRVEDMDQRRAGVYFRLERDLPTRTDQFGVEFRERLKWDIRQGVIDSETFEPKHAIIATWKNMTFAGGIDDTLYITNTFQVVLATDEVFTYAMFNYLDINWTTHTEAGGDTSNGVGGTPAYVGFNAGNGTQSFEYYPYSQQSTIRDLTERGCANGFKGRHIFRIDEKIMLGTCNKEVCK